MFKLDLTVSLCSLRNWSHTFLLIESPNNQFIYDYWAALKLLGNKNITENDLLKKSFFPAEQFTNSIIFFRSSIPSTDQLLVPTTTLREDNSFDRQITNDQTDYSFARLCTFPEGPQPDSKQLQVQCAPWQSGFDSVNVA